MNKLFNFYIKTAPYTVNYGYALGFIYGLYRCNDTKYKTYNITKYVLIGGGLGLIYPIYLPYVIYNNYK